MLVLAASSGALTADDSFDVKRNEYWRRSVFEQLGKLDAIAFRCW